MTQQTISWVSTQHFWKYLFAKMYAPLCSLQRYLRWPSVQTMAKMWKQPRSLLIEDWIKKMWSVYTKEYCSAIGKDEMLPFVGTRAWILRIQCNFTHLWDIKLKATNEETRQLNKQKLTDTDNSIVGTRGKRRWDGEVVKVKGVKFC